MTTVAFLAASPEGRTRKERVWLRDEAMAEGIEYVAMARALRRSPGRCAPLPLPVPFPVRVPFLEAQ